MRYEIIWCGTTPGPLGEKGGLLPPRPEHRHPGFELHGPGESLDLRKVLRAQTAHTPCQATTCRRHATVGRWCEWHAKGRRGQP